MKSGLLIGPYALQMTETKLKFWFALVLDDGEGTRRYEVSIGRGDKQMQSRHRPIYTDKVPTHCGNFNFYRVPSDLSAYPAESFPRFPRDKIADAAVALLQPKHIAAVTQLRMGIVPTLAKHGTQGDTSCTSRQQLPF